MLSIGGEGEQTDRQTDSQHHVKHNKFGEGNTNKLNVVITLSAVGGTTVPAGWV